MASPRTGTLLDVDGRTVHAIDAGHGTPVVVLHGCCSLAEEMMAALEPGARGLRLIAVDRPGYGFSDPLPEGGAGPAAQADWLADVMDHLGLDDAVVLAHSLGSATALQFGLRHPERLRALCLIAPFCRPTDHPAMPLMRALMTPVIGGVLRHAVLPRLVPLIGPSRLAVALHPDRVPDYLLDFPFAHAAQPVAIQTMAAELIAFNNLSTDAWAEIAAVAAPVSVIVGEKDTIADPLHHVDWLTSLLTGAEVTVMPGVGHTPHHADPGAVLDALRRLIRRAAAGPGDAKRPSKAVRDTVDA
ncbi:alpha/beta fold hydrolase [Chthonobacter rhizosphaerae]|uniref:alpha/beta fold hydrolase n=1 Tax=Chthonobacter rhizosphaerae TaxID=2735553 RepID=UPI0015EF14DC|nr:alpha/beta hydrolase [Chthonobacter rhizosphaerae]